MNRHKAGVPIGCFLIFGLVLAAPPFEIQSNADRTLTSFKRLDEYPLYVMDYYEDQGFGEYLKSGIRPDVAAGPDGASAGASSWRCSCFAVRTRDVRVAMGRNYGRVHRLALTDGGR
jgi:hypothetical protein